MTVGIFDGIHLGHQALLKNIVSHNAGYIPVVITFRENHKTKKTVNAFNDIQNFQERLKLFGEHGIKETIVIDFTEEFKRMSGNDFLGTLLKHGNIGYFAVGGNFRCGSNLDTDAKKIEKFFKSRDIPAGIVPEVMEGLLPVSSSRIRAAIADGDTKLAEKMLGRQLPP
jgi:riboflavin kinase/FMN adenylyltransferase